MPLQRWDANWVSRKPVRKSRDESAETFRWSTIHTVRKSATVRSPAWIDQRLRHGPRRPDGCILSTGSGHPPHKPSSVNAQLMKVLVGQDGFIL